MKQTFEYLNESVQTGELAKFADGSVLFEENDTVILATVVSERKAKDEDFLPLTVQYIEKAYAAGKFPGGFVKREGKPSDFEVLTSRIIDRSLRPLFPKGYSYETQITVMVLSCDENADLQRSALNAAAAALYIADLPIDKLIRGVRIAKKDGKFIVNPKLNELESGELDLFVAGNANDIAMIEMQAKGSYKVDTQPNYAFPDPLLGMPAIDEVISIYNTNELSEDELIEALTLAQNAINHEFKISTDALQKVKKPVREFSLKTSSISEELKKFVLENYKEKLENAITESSKSERSNAIDLVKEEILKEPVVAALNLISDDADYTIQYVKKMLLRGLILEHGKRPDGRGLREVRPISIQTGLLPKAHGSAVFTRGQTQALAIATLGSDTDKQSYELLTSNSSSSEKFSLHYNFPGFSVGEADRIGAPGRRELGHGNLAKRALECLIDPEFDHTIRVVSEVLESNGSSSMATVCAGALSMKSANVPLLKLASGIAIGLVKEGDKYAILSDIIGLEDFDGDMDFKIAGTRDGVTAMQLDIKLGGLDFELLKNALSQAKEGRLHILSIMESAEITVNHSALPSNEIFHIDAHKIVDIIGQAGKTIKEIIEKFEVAIDLNRENGRVKLTGRNSDKVQAAKEHIIGIAANSSGKRGGAPREQREQAPVIVKVDEVYNGVVKKITDFGAFVDMEGKGEGLMHISKMSKTRIATVKDKFNEGDKVTVRVIEIKGNKVSLANEELF